MHIQGVQKLCSFFTLSHVNVKIVIHFVHIVTFYVRNLGINLL